MDDKVRSLMEKIRGTADAVNCTARAVGRKAGQMVDVAKLNVQLYDLNEEYSDILRQLGQAMYDAHLGLAVDDDSVTQLLAQADETAGKVTEVKDRIADLRRTRNCPACGVSCGTGDKFCRLCGAGLEGE